jgi:phospholipase C
MSFAGLLKRGSALAGALAVLLNATASCAQTNTPSDQGHYFNPGVEYQDTSFSQYSLAEKIALLRSKVKYVFVIFHENESFDHYFGTFPGANGLFSAPPNATPANGTPSFVQKYLDTSLHVVTISPFLMPQAVVTTQAGPAGPVGTIVPVYPADEISVDHSHTGMANDLDINPTTGIAANDRYAMDQEGLTTNASGQIVTKTGVAPTSIALSAKQKAETDIGHIDCDTIPFMWMWAKNFVLFDNFRQSIVGPSTPNAIALIAGQSGQTQWALHNSEGPTTTYSNPGFQNVLGANYAQSAPPAAGDTNAYVPIVGDPGPFPGSNLDKSATKPPYNFDESPTNPSLNLTFASLPLSFMGRNIQNIIASDENPTVDLADVQDDITTISALNPAINWGWFQQGYNGNDASDPYEPQGTGTPNPTNNPGLYTGYVLHHNGPQYFGYLGDNTQVLANNLHGAADFFTAVGNNALPSSGGVFYLRGGYNNNDGLVPVDPTPAIQHAFIGNDDHPGYSDQQISEALAAKAINAIVNSPYWAQSVIIITYDETDGYYDHVSPLQRSTFADGSPLAAGPRIPTIVISPYAAAGKISHRYSEHGSVIKFIDELFGLVPLATLPDERRGRALGAATLGQPNLGPSDDPENEVGDLTEAFDYDILRGAKPPLSSSLAAIPANVVTTLPHLATSSSPNGYTNGACQAIGVLPTDFTSWAAYQSGTPNDPYPVDVNPRPTQSLGTPTAGNWTP